MEPSRHRQGHQTAQVTELQRGGVGCQTQKFKLTEPEQAHRGRASLCQGGLKTEFPGGSAVRTLCIHCWGPGFNPFGELRSHKQAAQHGWEKKKVEGWWGREEQDRIFQEEKQRCRRDLLLGEQQVPEAKGEKRGRGQLRRWGCPVCRLRRQGWVALEGDLGWRCGDVWEEGAGAKAWTSVGTLGKPSSQGTRGLEELKTCPLECGIILCRIVRFFLF